MLARRASAVPTGLGKATDVVVERAEGALVHDVDGNTFIDFVGGIGVLNAGHCPPEVVAAMQDEAQKLLHFWALVGTYEPYVELCERLNEVTPGALCQEDAARRTAAPKGWRTRSRRRARTPGGQASSASRARYHGRTLMTLCLTSKYSLFKKALGPFAPEILRLPMPNVYRAPGGHERRAVRQLGAFSSSTCVPAQVDPAEIAAIIIEPVQGEGGFIPVPPRFLRRLRELCTSTAS